MCSLVSDFRFCFLQQVYVFQLRHWHTWRTRHTRLSWLSSVRDSIRSKNTAQYISLCGLAANNTTSVCDCKYFERLHHKAPGNRKPNPLNLHRQNNNHRTNSLPVSSFVKFFSTNALDNLNLGSVITNETDVRLSSLEVLTENLQAGVEAELLICPKRKSEEELTSKYQCELDVKVLIEPAEDVASLRIFRKENDDFHVKFVPKVPGIYNMTVKINGNKLERSSCSDVMKSKNSLEQRFGDLDKATVPSLTVGSFVKFFPTDALDNLNLGSVETNEIDVQLLSMEALTENLQAGVEAELLIRPKRKSEEELTSKYQREFDVRLLIEPAEDVANLRTFKNENDDFHVKFVPKIPGTYNMTVKINGDELVTSPFRVHVKKRRIDVVGELVLKGEIPERPNWIAVNSKGTIAISDRKKHCIIMFDKDGNFVQKFGCCGKGAAG